MEATWFVLLDIFWTTIEATLTCGISNGRADLIFSCKYCCNQAFGFVT